MGADVSRCGCGADSRGDGKLDAGWKAPAALVRGPDSKGATVSIFSTNSLTTSPFKSSAKLPGGSPPVMPMDENEIRTLAARLLSDAKNGRTNNIKVMLASTNFDAEQTKAILEAQDHAVGNTPLMLAAKNGHADTCKLLIEKGSNVYAANRKHQTAIDLAATRWGAAQGAMGEDPVLAALTSGGGLPGELMG